MATSHVAHDCKLGDRITIANGTMLGGHVHVESHASISGGVAVHHYATIGGYSFVGGQSRIIHDVPRYMLVDGNPSKVRCINVVGLKRNGIGPEAIDALHEAHRLIYRAKMNAKQAAEILESHGHLLPEVQQAPRITSRRSTPASTAGPANAGGSHESPESRRRRGRAPGPPSRQGPRRDARGRTRRRRRRPARAGPGRRRGLPDHAPSPTTATCSTRSTPSPSPCPTCAHREVAGAFLERGIPTLVEKPLATTLLEAEELVELADRPRRRSSRSATSSGSTRPSRPSTAWPSGPSTSPPSGWGPTRSARPTSASCST